MRNVMNQFLRFAERMVAFSLKTAGVEQVQPVLVRVVRPEIISNILITRARAGRRYRI